MDKQTSTNAIEKLYFQALNIDGSNYLSWSLDIEAHLASKDLQDTILTDTGPTLQQKAKALILIRHHLADPLKRQYMNEYNPRILWDELHSRYDHTRTIFLPATRHDWVNLRVQDHKTIVDYNSELFRITSQLAICGHPVTDEEQIEKTLSTFHSTNLVISTQYRNMRFTKYSELIAHMLVAEKHQLLLLQNTRARPPGTLPPQSNTKANLATTQVNGETHMTSNRDSFRGRGNNKGRGRGRGNFSYRGRGRGGYSQRGGGGMRSRFGGRARGRSSYSWKRGTSNQQNQQDKFDNPPICHRCGTKGHIKKTCRAPAHLATLYKNSLNTNKAHTAFLDSEELLPEVH